MLETRKVDNNK